VIAPASWRDLNSLRHLEKVCFPQDAWPIFDLIGVLTFANVVRLKAVHDERMVGFIAGDIRGAENISWIATVGVLPEYRRQGIGKRLMQACEEQLTTRAIRLCVRLANEEAITLYQKLGYRAISTWQRYYQDGEDALVMEKIR
jgi:ribosomal-protein-alanine N-acetyltransferase